MRTTRPATPAALRPGAPARPTWRATTATRVFGLALATGQAIQAEVVTRSLPALLALVLLVLVWCLLELGRGVAPWIPVAEGLIAGTLLAGALPSTELYAYLAVPAVIAGIGQGWVTAVNASLAGVLGFFATSAAVSDLGQIPEGLDTAGVWLAVGLGAGLLAGWQTRTLRAVENRQAPYAAAHRLVAQLSDLTRSSHVALDSVAAAQQLGIKLASDFDCSHWAIHTEDARGVLEPLVRTGDFPHQQLTQQLRQGRKGIWQHTTAVLPLRVGDHAFGVVVLERESSWTNRDLAAAQDVADQLAIRIETSLLFDQVRDTATSEERNRLARDIHDGVAQEMVALGYLVDEIEDTTAESDTLRVAGTMRQEISRLVGELRMSIFDLRHDVDQRHLSGALAECVREVSAGSDLRVHLELGEHGEALSRRAESELLRIAQEAIGNVRRHAQAQNLWVTYATDGETIHLEIADDGAGHAAPRERHYGLRTMRERAERLGADLTIHERPGGGTVVTLATRSGSHATMSSPMLCRAEVT